MSLEFRGVEVSDKHDYSFATFGDSDDVTSAKIASAAHANQKVLGRLPGDPMQHSLPR